MESVIEFWHMSIMSGACHRDWNFVRYCVEAAWMYFSLQYSDSYQIFLSGDVRIKYKPTFSFFYSVIRDVRLSCMCDCIRLSYIYKSSTWSLCWFQYHYYLFAILTAIGCRYFCSRQQLFLNFPLLYFDLDLLWKLQTLVSAVVIQDVSLSGLIYSRQFQA
jgi:hypothetical protein